MWHVTDHRAPNTPNQKKRIHTIDDNNEVTEPEPVVSTDALQVCGMAESTWLSTKGGDIESRGGSSPLTFTEGG